MTTQQNDGEAIHFTDDDGERIELRWVGEDGRPWLATPSDLRAAGYVPASELKAVRLELSRLAKDDESIIATERARAEEAERRLRAKEMELKQAHEAVGAATREAESALAHRNQLQADLEAEWSGRAELRKRHGARDDETMGAFIERLAAANARAEEAERQAKHHRLVSEGRLSALERMQAELATANARAERLETALKVLATGFRAEGDDHWNEAARRAERSLGAALSAAPQASTEQVVRRPCPKCTSVDKFCSILGCSEEGEPAASLTLTAEQMAAVTSTGEGDPTPAEPQGRAKQVVDGPVDSLDIARGLLKLSRLMVETNRREGHEQSRVDAVLSNYGDVLATVLSLAHTPVPVATKGDVDQLRADIVEALREVGSLGPSFPLGRLADELEKAGSRG